MTLTPAERAYDRYVTVEQPGSWNEGFRDGFDGEPMNDTGQASEDAYCRGYDQGQYEGAAERTTNLAKEEA